MSGTDDFGSSGAEYCPDCGASIDANASICSECGRSLDQSSTTSTGTATGGGTTSGSSDDNEMLYVAGGAVSLLLGVFIFPILFVPLGTFLGYKARTDYDSTAGTVVMALGIIEIVLFIGVILLFVLLIFLPFILGASSGVVFPVAAVPPLL